VKGIKSTIKTLSVYLRKIAFNSSRHQKCKNVSFLKMVHFESTVSDWSQSSELNNMFYFPAKISVFNSETFFNLSVPSLSLSPIPLPFLSYMHSAIPVPQRVKFDFEHHQLLLLLFLEMYSLETRSQMKKE
jgi:hypothetical protein